MRQNESMEFVSWIEAVWDFESEWGNIVPADTPYLAAKRNGEPGMIYTTFRCALMEPGTLQAGDRIEESTVLAIVAAEGEEIAYGKPYSKFVKNT